MVESPEIPDAWRHLIDHIERDTKCRPGPRAIYVLGDTDTGKSTLCRHLVQYLASRGPSALLDADPGQSTLGPPTTLGLAFARAKDDQLPPSALRFVGSITPVGHLLQTVVGVKRLAERAAAEGAAWMVIDSPGLVAGETGREFQHQMIDLLGSAWLIVLGEGETVDAIASVFEARGRPRVRRLAVAPAVTRRNVNQRTAYRTERFESYFAHAKACELDLAGRGLHGHLPNRTRGGDAIGRVVALCDREGWVVVLGVVEHADWAAMRLHLRAPRFDDAAVASVEFGTHQL